jgi:uncharacterized protein (TIRG00374 family)
LAERPGVDAPGRQFPWRSIALYALAAIFLALVVWRSRAWEAGDEIDDVSLVALALVPLLSIAPAVPLALRSREILRTLGYRISSLALVPSSYYGNSVGFLTPASSGELLRPSLLQRGFGIPVAHGAAVVVFERLFSMYLFACSGLWAFTWTGVFPAVVSIALVPAFVVAPFAPALAVRLLSVPLQSLRAERVLPSFARRRLHHLDGTGESLKALWLNPRGVIGFALLSYLTFGAMLLQFWLLVDGLGVAVAPAEVWVVLVTSNLAGVASALPLGLGATDAVMVALLRAYDVDLSTAGAITVLMRCLVNLPTGLLGLAAYLTALTQRPNCVALGTAVVEARPVIASNVE